LIDGTSGLLVNVCFYHTPFRRYYHLFTEGSPLTVSDLEQSFNSVTP